MDKELLELLQAQDYQAAATLVEKYQPEDLADALKQQETTHEVEENILLQFYRAIDSEQLAEVLLLLDPELQEKIINSLRDDELEKVMDEISVDDTVEILEDMPQEIVRRIAELDDILKLLEERNYAVFVRVG